MEILITAAAGFALDLLLGDPERVPHPVIYMGRAISALEKMLRRLFPKTDKGELAAGAVLAVVMSAGTLTLTALACFALGKIHPALRWTAEIIWCWQALAMRGLRDETIKVRDKLNTDTLGSARRQVSRVVGRDTAALSPEGVTKAAVETVAENFSDGVIAPLFWMLIGGAPLALCYKAINTMDSMVGYKNEKYLYFGSTPARLDDLANLIPARISALLLILSAALCGNDAKNAYKIWRRDRRKHESPNSAQTESAMAGALGVRLAGPASYFGVIHEKPFIGDALRPIEPEDITRANRLMYAGSLLGLIIFSALRAFLCAVL